MSAARFREWAGAWVRCCELPVHSVVCLEPCLFPLFSACHLNSCVLCVWGGGYVGITSGGSEIACGVKVGAAGGGSSIFGAFSEEPQSRSQRWWLKSRGRYYYTVGAPVSRAFVACALFDLFAWA